MEANWLGQVEYRQALELQMQCIGRRAAGEIPDILLLLTHPHVYTIGRIGDDANLLVPPDLLAREGIPLARISRGGDITYHGPGQIVGYPIFDLDMFGIGVKKYIWNLEESIILTLAAFGITAERFEGATGVWIDTRIPARSRKICAIGVKVSRGITMHGFALNVNTTLEYFRHINPCGFTDKGVTSMEKELGTLQSMQEVKQTLLKKLSSQFGFQLA